MREKVKVPKFHHFEIKYRGAIVPGHFPSRGRAEAYALLMSSKDVTIHPILRYPNEKGNRQLVLTTPKKRRGRGDPTARRMSCLPR
jgi:hypothetical protein